MTILQIETAIKARLNRDTPAVSDNLREWVSQRQRQILRTKNFGFMWTNQVYDPISAGTREYDLPARFKDDYAMWFEKNSARSRIWSAEMQSLNNLYATNATGTQPIYYYPKANTFDLYPIPDATAATGKVVLEYYQYLADFSEDTDTNYLTDNYADLLIAAGSAEGFAVLGQMEETQLYEVKYEALLKECQNDDNEKSFSLMDDFAPNADTYSITEQGRVI